MPDVREDRKVQKIEGRVEDILRGMYCEHRRMRRDMSCQMCNERGNVHGVVCPDCGLTWAFSEGIYG